MKKLLLTLLVASATYAHADYSAVGKVTKVIMPYPPGGGVDITFRIMQKYAETQNITLVPEYKPGANALIGVKYAGEQPADGGSMLLTILSDVPTYQTEDKLVAISAISATMPILVTGKNSPLNTLDDVINAEKANPGKLNWAISSPMLDNVTTVFANKFNLDKDKITRIQYKGGAHSLTQLATGVVDVGFLGAGMVVQHVRAGNLKVIYAPRHGEGFIKQDGYGIFLPANTKRDVEEFWVKFSEKLSQDKESKELFDQMLYQTLPPGQQYVNKLLTGFKK